jgi:hypothetical protein
MARGSQKVKVNVDNSDWFAERRDVKQRVDALVTLSIRHTVNALLAALANR